MHPGTFISLSIAFALLAFSPESAAQERKLSLRFLAFPAQNPPGTVELLLGEGKTIEVEIPGHELSRRYEVPPLASIMVGETVADSEGKPAFKIHGQAKGIAAPEQIILLLRKGAAKGDGFVVLPIGADTGAFAGGSFLFINASDVVINGTIGNLALNISPGKMRTLAPKPDFAGDICQVTLSYLKEGKTKRFYDTRWPANKDVRALVIFYQNPQTGRLGIAPIMDIISRNNPGAAP